MNPKSSFIIQGLNGEKKLRGTVKIHGAKNAALKAMAAAVLFDGPVILKNVPNTEDIHTMSAILKKLGVNVEWIKNGTEEDHTMRINPSGINSTDIDLKLAGSMRASVVLTGPLMSRFGKASFPKPGGCVIGARPIDLFLVSYEKMGAVVNLGDDESIYKIKADNGLQPTEITFNKISVGATETMMMSAVLGKGQTILNNCALEPEIVNVAEWLNACGAKISGVGTSKLMIEGTNGKLLSSKAAAANPYVAISDRIEAGSFLILGALTASELTIENCRPDHITSVIDLLERSGVPIEVGTSSIKISNNFNTSYSFKSFDITTKEYPGFPTDLQPIISVYLTQVSGTSLVTENIFEGRFKYVDDLKSIGAKIEVQNTHSICINGADKLNQSAGEHKLTAHDIRAGFAMVMAALIGNGKFKVDNIKLIDRGYEHLDERLRNLGAKIERI